MYLKRINVSTGTMYHSKTASQSQFMVPSQMESLDVSCNQMPSWHSIMKELLCFDICNLPSSFMLDCEIEDLDHLVEEKISQVLQYSSKHWAQHLIQAGNANSDWLYTSLHYFLTEQFLFGLKL